MNKIKYETIRCATNDDAIKKIKNNLQKNKTKYYKFKRFKENYLKGLVIKIYDKKKFLVFHPNLIGYDKKEISIAKYDKDKFNLEDCKTYLADMNQLNDIYETTKELEKILVNLKLTKRNNRLVDFGCGFGSAIQYLSSKYDNIKLFGYDKNKKIMDIAKIFAKNENLKYVYSNFLKPKKIKIIKKVSCLFNIHTLCCFKDPEIFIKSASKLKPKFIIIKSLFYDGPMNTYIHTEEINEANKNNLDGDLNIFSKQMIIDIFKKYNYKLHSYKPFFMKKKIPQKKNIGRGSYTIFYNKRLNTYTGPIHLPWGFLILVRNK